MPRSNAPYEHYGIECGKGWRKLYEPLIKQCEFEGVQILQIKEKFGGLRFYIDSGSVELFKTIHAAEAASYHMCEICGADGSLRKGSWLKTLCDTHEAERN